MITKKLLDSIYNDFNVENFKQVDPCGVVYQLMQHTDSQLDIEIGALMIAMISWGSRKVFIPTALHMIKDEMQWKPKEFIFNNLFEDSYKDAKNQCVYRTLNVDTFKQVCRNIKENLQGFSTMEERLSQLTTQQAIAEVCRWLEPAKVGTMNKSACKRVCMFFRWMIRKNVPDMNIWKSRNQQDLYAIMDVHVCHQTKDILKNKQPTWKACEELTNIFKRWDKNDPLKYDIALMTLADSKQ